MAAASAGRLKGGQLGVVVAVVAMVAVVAVHEVVAAGVERLAADRSVVLFRALVERAERAERLALDQIEGATCVHFTQCATASRTLGWLSQRSCKPSPEYSLDIRSDCKGNSRGHHGMQTSR